MRTAHWSVLDKCALKVWPSANSLMSTSANDTYQACASVTMCGSNSQDARMAHHSDHTHRKLLIEEVVEHVLSVCLGVTVRCSRHVVGRRFHDSTNGDSIDRAAAGDTQVLGVKNAVSLNARTPSTVQRRVQYSTIDVMGPCTSQSRTVAAVPQACCAHTQSSHANSQFIK